MKLAVAPLAYRTVRALLCCACAFGCSATTDQPLFITQVAPPGPFAGGLCGAGATSISNGVFDLKLAQAYSSGYRVYPTAVNRMTDNRVATMGTTTTAVTIEFADVSLDFFPA